MGGGLLEGLQSRCMFTASLICVVVCVQLVVAYRIVRLVGREPHKDIVRA